MASQSKYSPEGKHLKSLPTRSSLDFLARNSIGNTSDWFFIASLSTNRWFKIVPANAIYTVPVTSERLSIQKLQRTPSRRDVLCSIHYQRIHPEYWRDRLLRVKAMGLNAIQVTPGHIPHHPSTLSLIISAHHHSSNVMER